MELGFILAALRRRWWIVVATTLVFGVLSSIVFGGTTETFKSEAVLLVAQNTRGDNTQVAVDANRYVQSQISAMDSESFQGLVADRVGGDETALSIDRATDLDNEPNTDIVVVEVITDSPQRSEQIAREFSSAYIENLDQDFDTSLTDQQQRLERQLDGLRDDLQVVNDEISAIVRPYIDGLEPGQPAADPSVIAPGPVSEREVLTIEFRDTFERLNALNFGGEIRVNSQVVQAASSAVDPIVESSTLQMLAGLVGGFGLGCLIALMLNRFSSKVADEAMVTEILGKPINATVPHSRTIARRPILALIDPPEPIRGGISRVSVAAESNGPVDRPTRIVVVGAQRGAGTTTLAMLVAHHFISEGATVTLVDADPKSDHLAGTIGGVDVSFDDLPVVDLDRFQSETVLVGRTSSDMTIKRADVQKFLEQVGRSQRIVVVDGGSVLTSATTVDLCHSADTVILAVPTNRQNISTLQAVARTIKDDDVLVVTTSPRRKSLPDPKNGSFGSHDPRGAIDIDPIAPQVGASH